jgi:integrase
VFPEWYPFVLCGLRTGLRLGELRGLQWGDIDWRRNYIHVQHNWVRSAWTTPKNGEDRTVDMSGQLRAQLRLWRRRQSIEWMRRGLSRPDLVFASTARTPHDDSKIRKVLAAILRKADLRHRSLHAMRHTFISLLLQNGESPAYVQKQVGHKSMDITINVYGHSMPSGNRAAVDRLDDGSRGQISKSA